METKSKLADTTASQCEHEGTPALEIAAVAPDVPKALEPEPPWSIGELAAQLGVTTRTIRFYESRHLITPAREKGARVYSRRDRARMRLILRGKNLGFTLEDIREYLSLYDADPSQVAQTKLLAQKVETSIADLELKKRDLERTLGELADLKERCRDFLDQRSAENSRDL